MVAQPGLPGAPSSTPEGQRFQSIVKSDTNSIPICVIQLRFVKPDLVTNANWASTRWPCQNCKTRESIALHSKIGVRLFAPVTFVCTVLRQLHIKWLLAPVTPVCTSYACLQPWGRSSVFSVAASAHSKLGIYPMALPAWQNPGYGLDRESRHLFQSQSGLVIFLRKL